MAMSIAANDDSGPIAEMNTTPLVDVMLVLLILFIITLPVMTNSTNLHIGRDRGPPPPPREAISLAIEFDGTILWNGTVVESLAQLERYFVAEARKANPAGAARATRPPGEVRQRRASAGDRPAQRDAAHRVRRAGTVRGVDGQGTKRKRQHPGVLAIRPA